MQKLLLFFVFSFFAVAFTWGQQARPSAQTDRLVSNGGKFQGQQTEVVNDTLIPSGLLLACGDTVTIYSSSDNWGYVTGTNGYGDKEKAQRFSFPNFSGAAVVEAWVFFAEKGGPGTAQITTKAYSAASATAAPGALLGTSTARTAAQVALNPTSLVPTIFPFPTAAALTSADFFLSVDINAAYGTGDTLGIFSTRDDCGGGAWEKFSDDRWFSFTDATSWGLSLSLYVLPILQRATSLDAEALRGQTYVSREGNEMVLVREGYAAHAASMKLYTAQGQLVADWQAQPGERATFDASQLPEGVYVWVVETAEGAFGLKFKY
jgi:hypothetical protein